MKIYNVRTNIVALVKADSEEEAISRLEQRLRSQNWTVYDGEASDAFESDDQDSEVDL